MNDQNVTAFTEAQSAERERAYNQRLTFLKDEAQRAGFAWSTVIWKAIPFAFREQAAFDYSAPASHLLDYVSSWLTAPRCGRCHMPTQSQCKRCHTPYCDLCCCWHEIPVCLNCHVILLREDQARERHI